MSLLLLFLSSGAEPPPVVEEPGQIMRPMGARRRPMAVREDDIDEALRLALERSLARQIAREDEELVVILAAL